MQKFVITEGENMTEKTLNNNQVVVAGEIASEFVFSHEIFGEGFYMVDLIVSRLSDAYDTIPLMVSDRLFDVNESHIGSASWQRDSSGHTTSMRRPETALYCLCL